MRARALVCLLAVAGCSFTMPDAPDRPYRTMPDCETSRAKPVIDMLGAGTALSLALVFALAAAIEDDLGDGEDTGELGTAALVSLGAGAVFTVSSIGGFRKGNRCRAAQAEFQTLMYYGPPQPYPYPPPAQTPAPAPTQTTTTTTPPPAQTTPPKPQPQPTPQPRPTPPASTVPVGAERGLCRKDGTCDPGLTCASGRCVFLPR